MDFLWVPDIDCVTSSLAGTRTGTNGMLAMAMADRRLDLEAISAS